MKISLVQLCSGRDVERNLARCAALAEEAMEGGADWILFPENAPFLGADSEKFEIAEGLDGAIVGHFKAIAERGECWVTLGSFAESVPGDPEHTYNTQLLIDPSGELVAVYRKIHLFDVEVEGGQSFLESGSVAPGADVVAAQVTGGDARYTVGMSICYDLRFPELYRKLSDLGAQVLTVPAAFTLQTGRDHWHPLLAARAIENQAYVLAPNQWGNHYGQRSSYGHSAVYDPWGRMVACASDAECVVNATLDIEFLRDVRRRMPCLTHRRLSGFEGI